MCASRTDGGHGSGTRNIAWQDLDPKKYVFWGTVFSVVFDGALYPADLVKTRLQVQGTSEIANYGYRHTLHAFRHILRQEGIRGFFKGFGVQCFTAVPTQLTYYGTYEFLKDRLSPLHRETYRFVWSAYPDPGVAAFVEDLAAGAAAEAVSGLFWIPNDIVTQRLMIQGADVSQRPFANGREAARYIARTEGIRGFYRGIGPTMATYVPASGVSFAVYQATKKFVYSHDRWGLFSPRAANDDDEEEGYHGVNFVAGLVAGAASTIVSNPFDVAKTRIQTEEHVHMADHVASRHAHLPVGYYPTVPPKYIGTLDTISKIAGEEGVRVLFRGLSARMLAIAPATSLGFATYELIKMLSMKSPPRQSSS